MWYVVSYGLLWLRSIENIAKKPACGFKVYMDEQVTAVQDLRAGAPGLLADPAMTGGPGGPGLS